MPGIAARFADLLAMLRKAIAAQLDRQARGPLVVLLGTQYFVAAVPPPRLPPLPAETWVLLWHRLGRLANRFQTLFDRWRTNRLPRRRAPATRRRQSAPESAAPEPEASAKPAPPPRLPRAHGWVNHRIPESAPPTGFLEALLNDPEARAFVAAAPQAGRLLRPLCRALGLALPDWLRLPARPRPPKPAARPKPAAPPPLRHPLPAYVRAAARAWKRRGG